MINSDQEFGFSFDDSVGARSKFFNIDGTETEHVNIWVEAYDDRRFWLSYIKSNSLYKFSFKTPDEAQSNDGKIATGCERLFSLERSGDITLGKHNIFCLDSDDSFIKNCIPNYSCRKKPRNFLFFTNIYAVENAILDPEHLDQTLEIVLGQEIPKTDTPPSKFILTLSRAIFPAFLNASFLEATTNYSEISTKLRAKLTNEIKSLADLDINEDIQQSETFKSLSTRIQGINTVILQEINSSANSEKLIKFITQTADLGIDAENVYLFINGHMLYDLITHIYQKYSDVVRQAETARLKTIAPPNPQAIKCLKNAWPKFSEYLRSGFFAKAPNIQFLKNTFDSFEKEYGA